MYTCGSVAIHVHTCGCVCVQERPYPRRPADMPSFPTADTPAGSTHKHTAAQHNPAARQHMAECVEAARVAAGLQPTIRDDEADGGHVVDALQTHQHADLPATLYQRYDQRYGP